MKRWLNKLAWKLVKATASRTPKQRCAWCHRAHRTQSAIDTCAWRQQRVMAHWAKLGR